MFERETLSIPAMRRVLGDTLRDLGVNEDSVADILLAATEACTNVVLHAGHSVSVYEVAATIRRGACRVEVTDAGGGCPRPRLRVPRARGGRRVPGGGGLAESGRGFTIMRACVDDVRLRSSRGRGTRVVLNKRIRWEGPAAAPRGTPRSP